MTHIKSTLSHLFHKSTPVVAENMPLIICCNMLRSGMEPTRFVRKVEMCTALAAGKDAWGTLIEKTHHHTLLRVCLEPSSDTVSEDVVLVERVLSTAGSFHSVTPIEGSLSTGGTLFHPDVHDRMCIISEGSSTALAHDLEVERTLEFGDDSSAPRLTLAQLAQVLDFLSRTTTVICAGGDCKFQSRSFAFTCMSALTPSLPASTSVRKGGEAIRMNVSHEPDLVDDSVFELGAKTILAQVPWLSREVMTMHHHTRMPA